MVNWSKVIPDYKKRLHIMGLPAWVARANREADKLSLVPIPFSNVSRR